MKTAILVEFAPRTRVVVDIPENQSVLEWAENSKNFDLLVSKARKQIIENDVENYLSGDNVTDYVEDEECPYGIFYTDYTK